MNRSATISWLGILVALSWSILSAQEQETPEEKRSPFKSKTQYKEGEVSPFSLEPPDGRWLIDDSGKEYFVAPIPKNGIMKRLDETTLTVPRFNVRYTILREDDENYYVKINRSYVYNTGNLEAQIKDEDRAAAAETYVVTGLQSEDRWVLEAFDEGLPKSGMWRNGFDLADMNGDGHIDLIHGPPRKGPSRPYIFLGDSKGNWIEWPIEIDQRGLTYGDIAAGDFNNDGHMDLAFGLHLSGLTAYTGDGQGGFTLAGEGIPRILPDRDRDPAKRRKAEAPKVRKQRPGGQTRMKEQGPREERLPLPFTSRAIDMLDWDQDGDLDIMAVSEGPRGIYDVDRSGLTGVVIYSYEDDGSWRQIRSPKEEFPVNADHIYPANLNGDDLMDFVTSSGAMGFHKLLNIHLEDHTWQPSPINSYRSMAWAWSIAVGDLDQDGLDDLVVGYRNHQLRIPRTGIDVFLNRDRGTRWERRPLWSEIDKSKFIDYQAMELGDFDGDGALDLVATSKNGRLELFRGDGEGFFTQEATEEFEAVPRCRGFHIRTHDLDSDGREEIVASFAGEECPRLGSIRAFKVLDKDKTNSPTQSR